MLPVTLRKIEGKFSGAGEVFQSGSSVADHHTHSLLRVPYGTRGSGPLSVLFLPHVPSKRSYPMGLQQKATYTDFGKV